MIKILLIGSLLLIGVWLLRGPLDGRHLALRRLAGLCFAGAWIIAVLAPEVVTRVANLVGVGRGADLVLYVLAVAFVFNTMAQAQHLHRLDDRLTALTRALALRTVEQPVRPDD